MSGERLGHIDFARGVAILLVILHHQAEALVRIGDPGAVTTLIGEYGQTGVHLFFVASALTLCLSAERRREEAKPLLGFYLRRFFRIAPLYYSGIALYAAVHWLTHRNAGPYTADHILANLLFVHGFDKEAINDVVPGGWSISAEMMFYAIFPFAFALAERVARRWGPVPIALATVAAYGLYVAAWTVIPRFTVYEVGRSNIFYYWPPAQMIVFAVGIAGYFMLRGRRTSLLLDAVGFIVPTAISLALWRSDFTAAFAAIPACSALSFVFLINLLARLPKWEIVPSIGRVSFSMYVLHFLPVWFLAPFLLRLMGTNLIAFIITYAVTVLIAFAAAQITKNLIEDRGDQLGKRVIAAMRRRPAPATS